MVVLKGVPALLSPELLYALARMGHGDEIVFADVNFPTSSICRGGPEEIRADGLGIPQLLEAVLKLLPLDTYVETPAAVMELVPSDRKTGLQTPVWRSYQSILFEAGCVSTLAKIERFEFYERAKKAFAVVATGPSFRHAGADAGMNGGSWTSGSLRAWGRLPCLGPGLVSRTSRRPWRAGRPLGWRSGAQPGEGTLPGVSHCQGLTSDP
ncbi:fucose mutarotase isoform X1 [Ursus americanus]|uniref:Fucose mutarotase n=2 Tax=Ursus TaxID=9639 RepID=A0A8M1FAJ1_URSMA|nr:fucose mutarotase isoform X2 [Ursus arctos]XP_040480366.1 fucose mutarotase isoform X2 [Ursus maritimus]XP_045665360.1 fucose mutarotase isoform X1 [Ursus americanus]